MCTDIQTLPSNVHITPTNVTVEVLEVFLVTSVKLITDSIIATVEYLLSLDFLISSIRTNVVKNDNCDNN